MGASGGRVQQQAPSAEPEVLRRAPVTATGASAPAVATAVTRRGGAPLDPGTRREAERRHGHDFGSVRVHSGPEASEAVDAVGAPAFTLGRHVVVGDGLADPATPDGRAILSHELTHVVQQAAFGDRALGGAQVLDATHPAEHEARAGTAAVTPLAGPAIQRAPVSIVNSGQMVTMDLSASGWRAAQFAKGQTQIVYVLRDTATGEILKVGKTAVARVVNRFGEYAAAGNKWGRKLAVDVFTLRKRGAKAVEQFEKEVRAGFEKTGERLPWDNTKRRLGRAGKGIPEPKPFSEEAEVQAIDDAEQAEWAADHPPSASGVEAAGEESVEEAGEQVGEKVEQKATQAGTDVAGQGERVAVEGTLETTAEGALTKGLGATALEVVFNPALLFGWEVLKGISADYQQAWDDIRRPARHIGFAQGWAARLAGLDMTWIKWNLAPRGVDRTDVATEVLGAAGMAEQAYVIGISEGFRYGAGYSAALRQQKLGEAFEKIKARGEEVHFDTDDALTRNSLILVAAMLQQEADRAVARWDDLRAQRKKTAEDAADVKRRSEHWTGHFQ